VLVVLGLNATLKLIRPSSSSSSLEANCDGSGYGSAGANCLNHQMADVLTVKAGVR